MSIIYSGIEWDYDNLSGITYDSETLLEPYATWVYLITGAINTETENINLGLTDEPQSYRVYTHKDNIIKFSENSNRLINSLDSESFNLTENGRRNAKYFNSESFNLTENGQRNVTRRGAESRIYLLDECKYITYNSDTGIENTVEQVELSGSMSLFDFELHTSTWSEDDFTKWCDDNSPINYDALRPFIPGEYEYKNAYVGFRLFAPPEETRFGVVHSVVYADVEDTVEKGTAVATVGSLTQVNFSKRFYTSPHIMTSLLYSVENCYIEVSDVNREGFKFGLKSINTGNYLNGEINWLADGY